MVLRRARSVVCFLSICVLAVALPATAGSKSGKGGKHKVLDPAGIERLKANAGDDVLVSTSDATGGAKFVRFGPGKKGDLMKAAAGKTSKEKADAFLAAYGSVFGLRSPAQELKLQSENADLKGGKHLSYGQLYEGVPVFAGVLKAHLDVDGNLTSVNGNVVPEIDVASHPTRTGASAAASAVEAVSDDHQGADLSAASVSLVVYRTGLAQGVDGDNYLTWQVEVGNGSSVREFVYVDAHTGAVVDRLPGIIDNLDRRAYNGLFLPAPPPAYPGSPFWVEGQPFPTGTVEADNMLMASAETWGLYSLAFGRDSFDGAGKKMDSIFNRGYSCPNASWNGTFISFCNGLTTDDVTAHEWTHAYTQYTHGLIYAWQPGALNESYSDIYGETIDRINGRDQIGNSATDPARTDACSSFSPPRATVIVNSPAAIAGAKAAQAAGFGPTLTTTGPITANVVLALDAANGSGPLTTDACTAITNASAVAGKIALVYRGTCTFSAKVYNAQLAGAIGVLVANNTPSGLPGMGAGVNAALVTIPSVGITQGDGNAIVAQPAVNATMRSTAGATDPSTRWLLGEDSTAVGLTGALRDMYNPTCYSNPGKVSDTAYYVCGTADSGGVHTNSGVPNHAYSLLVDGGVYNGYTIPAIGLTKAAHIYFRAMAVYQHPASDFPDHADALEESANDLLGVNLPDLVTGAPSGQSITAADVAAVHEATLAVEFRNPPVQCAFVPILAKNPPAVTCPALSVKRTVFNDGFEGSTASWTIGHVNPSATFTPRDWSVSNALPDNRPGSGFFAPDPNIGTCTAAGDETGVLSLTSASVTLPAAMSSAATLTFEHWLATEAGFDGGQLLISVNGGPFTLVPQAQFLYNAHNRVLATVAQGNSNPRAAQRAWSGTDGGSVSGSWGRSVVTMSGLAAAGDSIRMRWDLSTDGCGGNPIGGWYLDDVAVTSCEPDADADGVRDADDQCPGTVQTPTIVIGTGSNSDTGVPNMLFASGCTMAQNIEACAASAANHGDFVNCVAGLTNDWVAAGLITGAQKGSIMQAASQSK